MIRVCLVEDQTLVRQGIRGLLDLVDDIEVVGEAADGEEALGMVREFQPDVLLLDLRLPRMSGIETLSRLREDGALPATLCLTTFDDDNLVLEAVRAGARGFMLKDVSLEQLARAIRSLAGGGTLIQPGLTERMIQRASARGTDFPSLDDPFPLTDRERDVLRLMAGGFSNREIAEALGLMEGTVKNHVSNILSKLGVRDRTRAVLKAIEQDWIR